MIALLDFLAQGEPYIKEGFGQSDAFGKTGLHPLGLVVLLSCAATALLARRRYAALPLLFVAALIPPGQRLVIATLDFDFVRLNVLFAWARIAMRGEARGFRLRGIDYAVLAWGLIALISRTALKGSVPVNQLGNAFDLIGIHFTLRIFFRSWTDLDQFTGLVARLSLPVFVLFLFEHRTGTNLFSFMGGVGPEIIAREGRMRCQGPFPHPILAGYFWAALFPLVAARASGGRDRIAGLCGSVAILGIVYFSGSSTPVLGVACSVMALASYPLRRYMRFVRWGALFGVVGLHMVMKAPVWHLLGRVGVVGGSTGYHRFKLIDATINNFGEWWLMGTLSTAHWGRQLFDLTNQYVAVGVTGGVGALAAFIAVIMFGYGHVGGSLRAAGADRYRSRMAWGFGCSIFAQMMMLIAVSITFSAANLVAWFAPLAMAATGAPGRKTRVVRSRAVASGAAPVAPSSRRGDLAGPAARGLPRSS